jgi:tetratricopeptide (TPR) repeat protein
LLWFAPVRFLPKRVRVDVIEDNGKTQVHALMEDSFFMQRLNGLIAGKYRRQFDDWIERLRGQVSPSAALPQHLNRQAAARPADSVTSAQTNGGALGELSALFLEEPPGQVRPVRENAPFQTQAMSSPSVEESPEPGLNTDVAPQGPEPHEKPMEVVEAASSARGGLRFPRLPFGRRKRDTAVSQDGLPAEVRRLISLADEAVEAKAWSRALTHYDAAVQALIAKDELAGDAAASRLFLMRGIARLGQAESSLSSLSSENSVSDYQIALEAIRQAVADYSEAIRRDPRSSMSYYQRGLAHLFAARCERGSRGFRRSSEEVTEAIADLNHAIERDPTFAPALSARASARSLLGHHLEAAADVERATSLGSDESTTRGGMSPASSADPIESFAESGTIDEPELDSADDERPETKAGDTGERKGSKKRSESRDTRETNAGLNLNSEVPRADFPTPAVDLPEVTDEIHHPRLRLPKLPTFGRQSPEEISLSGVGVITSTEVSLGERDFAARDWDGAIRHFDIAIASLVDLPGPDWSNAIGLARVFFQRGLARFNKTLGELQLNRRS